jgi:hypothetical protein
MDKWKCYLRVIKTAELMAMSDAEVVSLLKLRFEKRQRAISVDSHFPQRYEYRYKWKEEYESEYQWMISHERPKEKETPFETQFLEYSAEECPGNVREADIDEGALLGRGSPAIDLAIARYGRSIKTVSSLFQNAKPGTAIRLACLSNQSLSEGLWLRSEHFPFPTSLLSNVEEEDWFIRANERRVPCSELSFEIWSVPSPALLDWVGNAPDEELDALFENPTLSPAFVYNLFRRKESWSKISDERLLKIVDIIGNNERLKSPWNEYLANVSRDYKSEYYYNHFFYATWELAGTVPVSDCWAIALAKVFRNQPVIESDNLSEVGGPLLSEVLGWSERWLPIPCSSASDRGYKGLTNTSPSEKFAASAAGDPRGVIRRALAKVAISGWRKEHDIHQMILNSEDIAFRSAAYSVMRFTTAEQLEAGFERDREIAREGFVLNPRIWESKEARHRLRYLLRPPIYKQLEKEMFVKLYNSDWRRAFDFGGFDSGLNYPTGEQLLVCAQKKEKEATLKSASKPILGHASIQLNESDAQLKREISRSLERLSDRTNDLVASVDDLVASVDDLVASVDFINRGLSELKIDFSNLVETLHSLRADLHPLPSFNVREGRISFGEKADLESLLQRLTAICEVVAEQKQRFSESS